MAVIPAAAIVVALLATASSASATDAVLFPSALHITREVRDPVSESVLRVDEYYYGNRAVSIREKRAAILDYSKNELTEIDHAAGTYSITRFEDLARAFAQSTFAAKVTAARNLERADIELRAAGSRQLAGRQADVIEVRPRQAALHAVVALDREVRLSRDAFDVVIGAAYPNHPNREHELIATAAREGGVAAMSEDPQQQKNEQYRLALEQTFSYQLDGDVLQLRSTVITVDAQLPPPELIVIPNGARRVEGAWVQRVRMLEQLDRP